MNSPSLPWPNGQSRALLHICCAPCSSAIIPRAEYGVRKAENIRFAESRGVAVVDADYDPQTWLERTARYAHEHGFAVFTASLGISRGKDFQQVSACG